MKQFFILLFTLIPFWLSSQTIGIFQPLGGGSLSGAINSFAIDSSENKLYVAGSFNDIGGLPIKFKAKLGANSWDSIPQLPITIQGFDYVNGVLFAYGYKALWKKISGNWIEISHSNIFIDHIANYNGQALIMGSFDTINNIPLHSFALYDGTNLQPFSNYMRWPLGGGSFWTSATYNNELYIGGNFSDSSGNLQRLMKWNGTHWTPLSNSIMGSLSSVSRIVVLANKLYVGGMFSIAGGNFGNCIYSFDGTNYDNLGGGLFTNLFDMTVHNNKIFIVGPCRTNAGREFKGFVTFDGTDFCFYDSVPCATTQGSVFLRSIFFNDTLILAGGNRAYNGDTTHYISKYSGNFIPQNCVTVVSVDEQTNPQSAISIYPNPATNSLTLALSTGEGMQSVKIYNVLGELVLDYARTDKKEITLDVSKLQRGIYVVVAQTEKGLIRKKVIKN